MLSLDYTPRLDMPIVNYSSAIGKVVKVVMVNVAARRLGIPKRGYGQRYDASSFIPVTSYTVRLCLNASAPVSRSNSSFPLSKLIYPNEKFYSNFFDVKTRLNKV